MNTEQLEMRLIPLDQVRPDPEQPRRLLPSDLAQALVNGTPTCEVLLQLRSRGERDKWTRERLAELDALAKSIDSDGLMQPIRVILDGDARYRIEEGERRWWAHQILAQQGKAQFQHIAAFVVKKDHETSGLLRRRVAENVLRSGFTAIELAKAMASRIQEIVAAEPGIKRSDAERCVGSENGMSDRRVRQFVALLTLSPQAQELAQLARLTENSLRRVVGIKDSARQLAAIRELMHPAPPKSRKTMRKKKRGPSDSSRRSNGHDRKRAIGKPSALARKPSRQNARHGSKSPMQKLLALARSLEEKDSERLSDSDWSRVNENETDRRNLLNLHQILTRGLGMATGNNEGAMERAHE